MMSNTFKGTGVALVTPFDNNNNVDYSSLKNLLEYIIEGGVDFIAMMGTTGEPATLTQDEKQLLRKFVVENVAGRIPIMYGIGGCNTAAVIDEIKNTDFTGIEAILSISPFYTKPSQRGIYEHFKAIDQVSPLPLMLYNVPGRTGRNIDATTVIQIANDCKKVFAVKEASGNMAQIMSIIETKPKEFSVFSGDDALTLPMYALGASGAISVVANVAPKQYSQMVHLCEQGNYTEAAKIHYQLLGLANALFEDGSPSGAKAALAALGIIKENVRLPLVPVGNNVRKKIKSYLECL